MVDRRALAGGPALTGPAHPGIFQILIEYKYVNKMKQHTAVDWLEMIVKSMIDNGGDFEELMLVMDHIEEAKEIEKQQIIKAYKEGHYHLEFDSFNPEQYYNQTYSK